MRDTPCFGFKSGVLGKAEPLDNLRLEVSPDQFQVLSYHHLDSFSFESTKDKDTITASFYHHRARIVGRHLRNLAIEIQHRTVEFIKAIPDRYGSVADSEGGVVESVEVEVLKME
jgi:hypothetical protein